MKRLGVLFTYVPQILKELSSGDYGLSAAFNSTISGDNSSIISSYAQG